MQKYLLLFSIISSTAFAQLNVTLLNKQDATCDGYANGTAIVSASGGTSPYTYSWNTNPPKYGASVSGLAAGTYTVYVEDDGTFGTETGSLVVTIYEPTPVTAQSTSNTNPTCYSGSNGSSTIIAGGGNGGPYTYTWSSGGHTASNVTSLSAGNYSVTVRDFKNCQSINPAVVMLSNPPQITISENAVSNILCYGDSTGLVSATASGGTGSLSYTWFTSPTPTYNDTLSNIPAGTYMLMVHDLYSCSKTKNISVTQPSSPLTAITTYIVGLVCYGDSTGTATISGSGGTAGYLYTWSNGQTSDTLSGVAGGTYSGWVVDANGCMASETINITEGNQISSTSSTIQASCHGTSTGSATVTATGGASSFSYSWSNGVTTSTIANVQSGNYHVTITDGNGCSIIDSNIIVPGPTAINIVVNNISPSHCSQSDGDIDINVSGGTPSYSYDWSNGSTASNITNIPSGLYAVIVTDGKGCTKQKNITVNNVAGPSVIININGDSATATITGGTGPFTYSWNTGASTETITGLTNGSYTVIVTDSAGCMGVDNAVFVGIDQQQNNSTVFVINPTIVNDFLRIEISNNAGSIPITLTIHNLIGEVTTNEAFISTNKGIEQINVSNLQPGIYLVTLRSRTTVFSKKFVKE